MKKVCYLSSIIFATILMALSVVGFSSLKARESSKVYAASITNANTVNYVSLGDSIASGYKPTGYDRTKEYGNSNSPGYTPIVSHSYTAKIKSALDTAFGAGNVNAISYARSGLETSHPTNNAKSLIYQVTKDSAVRESISKADLITISIGANNILQPALDKIYDFVKAGSDVTEAEMLEGMYEGLENSKTDYTTLINEMCTLNPNAQIVFTTVYNPYRGFGLEYKNHVIFELDINDLVNIPIDVKPAPVTVNDGDLVKHYINKDRVNMVAPATDVFLNGGTKQIGSQTVTIDKGLNQIIRESVANSGKSNVVVADVASVFNARSMPSGSALTDSDKFRGGPGTSRDDKGVVYAWLNTERGIIDVCTSVVGFADWGQCYNAGWDAAWDSITDDIDDLSWRDLIKLSTYTSIVGNAVWAYGDGWVKRAIVLIEDEMDYAVDPHPNPNGHTVIKDTIMDVITLVKLNTNVKGGSTSGNLVKKGEISRPGQLIQQPTSPTRDGYNFVNWYKEDSCSNAWNFASDNVPAGTKQMTIYANWTPITYYVEYNGNGHTSGSTAKSTHTYDTPSALTSNGFFKSFTFSCQFVDDNGKTQTINPTKANAQFLGWAENANGNAKYDNGENVSVLCTADKGTVTLYAVWGSAEFKLPKEGEEVKRTGYTLKGWRDSDGYQYLPEGTYTTGDPNTVLTAVWEAKKYTATFVGGGGRIDDVNDSIYVGSGEKVTKSFTYDQGYTGQVAPSSSTISLAGSEFGGYYLAEDWRGAYNTDNWGTTIRISPKTSGNYFKNNLPYVYMDITFTSNTITSADLNDTGLNEGSCLYYWLSPDKKQLKFLYKVELFDVADLTIRPFDYSTLSFVDVDIAGNTSTALNFTINEFWISNCASQITGTDGKLVANLTDFVSSNKWIRPYNSLFVPKWTKNEYRVNLNSSDKETYTILEYIEATGTQYIDTGLIINKTDSAEILMDYQLTSLNGGYMGANGYLQINTSKINTTSRVNVEVIYKLNSDGKYIETIHINNGLPNSEDWTTRYNGKDVKLGIFRLGDANNSWHASTANHQAKLYSMSIWKNGILVRDFVPVKNAVGEIGLFDAVEKKFYRNAGTGTFTAGAEKGKYQFLGYLESDGNQYIDTGVVALSQYLGNGVSFQGDVEILSDFHPSTYYGIYGNSASLNNNLLLRSDGLAWTSYQYGLVSKVPYTKGQRYYLSGGNGSLKVNGISYFNTMVTDNFTANFGNLYIFRCNPSQVTDSAKMRVYSFKIVNDPLMWGISLLRNFTPVIKEDGTVGLFDIVNKVLYTNKGTGSFTYGDQVLEYGENYDYLQTPTKDGYSFDGWETNLFHPDMNIYKENYYYNGTNGEKNSGEYIYLTEYSCYKAYVVPGATYRIVNAGTSTTGSYAPGVGIYDQNGNFIERFNYNRVNDFTYTMPSNAYYVIFSVVKDPTSERYDKDTFQFYGQVNTSVRMLKPENYTLVAKWIPHQYTIKYNANGGTGTTSNSTHHYGTSSKLTANAFTKTGYSFDGWNTNAEGTGTNYTNQQEVLNLTAVNGAEIILYAKWKANTYAVTLDAKGGTVNPTSITVTYNQTYGTLPTPTRTNYTFNGWFTEVSGGTKINGTETYTTAGAQTLYAQWTLNTFTLTINPDGGTVAKNLINPYVSVGSSSSQITASNISYYIDADGKIIAKGTNNGTSDNYGIIGGLTVYLAASTTYNRIMYTDRYPDTSTVVEYGWFYSSSIYTHSSGHNTFASFKTKSSAGGIYNLRVDANAYNNVLTATGFVVYKDTTTSSYTQTMPFGTFYALAIPTRTGYTFKGWEITSGNGQLTKTDPNIELYIFKQSVAGDVTVTAQWEAIKHTINISSNNTNYGTVDKTKIENITYNSTISISDNTLTVGGQTVTATAETVTGYTNSFSSWSVSDGTNVTSDLNITATFTQVPITYTVKYNANGGSGDEKSVTHTYGVPKKLEKNTYTRTGYTFNGWNTNANGTGTAYTDEESVENLSSTSGAEVKLYAQWTVNSYTVTLDANGGTVNPTSITVTYNQAYGDLLTTPTKDGHTFDGWFTAKSGGNKVDSTTIFTGTSNHTLYAHWSIISHNVYLIQDTIGTEYYLLDYIESTGSQWIDTGISAGGTWEFDIQFTKLNTRQLMGYNGSKDQYWGVNSSGYYEVYSSVGVKAGNRDKVKHVYGPNVESGLYINGTKYRSTSGTENLDTYYIFKLNGTGAYTYSRLYSCKYYNESNVLTRDFIPVVRLSDKAVGMYDKVTKAFYSNVGTGEFVPGYVLNKDYGETYGTLPTPTKDGYTFKGWYTEKSGGTLLDGTSKVTALEDEVYYAQWEVNQYTITFDPNGGGYNYLSNSDFQSVSTNTSLGWDNNLNGTLVPNGDWSTGFNGGVSSPTIGYHAHLKEFPSGSGNYALRYKTNGDYVGKKDAVNSKYPASGEAIGCYRWLGFVYPLLNKIVGTHTYRITMDVYRASGTGSIGVAFHNGSYINMKNIETNETNTLHHYRTTKNGVWETITHTFTISKYTGSLNFYIYGYYAEGEIYVDNVSLVDVTSGVDQKTTSTQSYNSNYGFATTPARIGYTFAGWYTAATGGTRVTTSTKITNASNHTLYAHWEPIQYTIAYNAGDGSGTMSPSTHTYDVAKTLTKNTFTKTGYTFVGWEDENGNSYSDQQSVVNLTITNSGIINLTAQWEINKYTVTIKISQTGWGTVSPAKVENVPYGTELNLTSASATINGQTVTATPAAATAQYTYAFENWTNGSTTVTGNMEVVANFSRTVNEYSLTITANDNLGKINEKNPLTITNIPYGTTLTANGNVLTINTATTQTATAEPNSKTGYIVAFSSWQRSGEDFTSLTITGNTNVVAYFGTTPITYKVKYNGNGSTSGSMADSTLTYDRPAQLTANAFEKLGYRFIGWNTVAGGTGDAYADQDTVTNLTSTSGATVNLYAQWEALPSYLSSEWEVVLGDRGIDASQKVKSIEFLNGTTLPDGYEENKYVSIGSVERTGAETNSSVLAYYKGDSTNGYDIVFVSPSGGTIYAPIDCTTLFSGLLILTTIEFDNFNTSGVTNMKGMFQNSTMSTITGISSWDVSSVETMESIFYGSQGLTEVDLSEWETMSLTNMKNAFMNCHSLTKLNLSGWNTSKVTYMGSLISTYLGTSLLEVNISGFDLSSVDGSVEIFAYLSSVNKIYLPKEFSDIDIYITVASDMIVHGTQSKVVVGGALPSFFTSQYEGKVLVRANTVTANANGGTIASTAGWSGTGNSAIRYVEYDKTLSVLPTVSRTGYIFNGWNTKLDGTGTAITAASSININTTIYAQWEIEEYTISYNLDGGTVSTANPSKYNVETNTFTLNNPTKTGYNFIGWVGSNGTTPQKTVTIAKGSIGDKSYTAKYEIQRFKITIQANNSSYGSVNETEILNVPYGSEITVTGNEILITPKNVETGTLSESVEIVATAKDFDNTYYYEFVDWAGVASTVTSELTITANFRRLVEIRIASTGANANNDYGIDVLNESESKIVTKATSNFKLETDKVYTIKTIWDVLEDVENQEHQILRVYVNNEIHNPTTLINSKEHTSSPGTTIFSKSTLTAPMSIEFEYLKAYYLDVKVEENTIGGMSLQTVNMEDRVIYRIASGDGYIITLGTKVEFSIDAYPVAEPASTFIGFNYSVVGKGYQTVGHNGSVEDIKYVNFVQSSQHGETHIGTYYYQLLNDKVRSIEVLTVQSFKISVNTSELTTTMELTSQHGFNKSVDSSTEFLALYIGDWTITSEASLSEIRKVFENSSSTNVTLTIVEDAGKIILRIAYKV